MAVAINETLGAIKLGVQKVLKKTQIWSHFEPSLNPSEILDIKLDNVGRHKNTAVTEPKDCSSQSPAPFSGCGSHIVQSHPLEISE